MTGFEAFWEQGDAITRAVALLLLAMSVSASTRYPHKSTRLPFSSKMCPDVAPDVCSSASAAAQTSR